MLSSVFGSWFGGKREIKGVNVHFDKRKLRVTFTPEDYDSQGQVPINAFRLKLANALNVPPRELVLYQVNPQRKLSNMQSTLNSYGIKDNGDILAVHVRESKAADAKPAQPAQPKKQLTAKERIDAILSSAHDEVGDRIAKLVADGPPADPAKRETENRVLTEVVLAKMISLDDVEVQSPEERQYRKSAIAKLQKYHTDIDQAMAKAEKQSDPVDQPATESAKNSEADTSSSNQAPAAGPHASDPQPASGDRSESPAASASSHKKKKSSYKKKKKNH